VSAKERNNTTHNNPFNIPCSAQIVEIVKGRKIMIANKLKKLK
jgi:hypothetical protein